MNLNTFARTTRAGLGVAVVSLALSAATVIAQEDCSPDEAVLTADPFAEPGSHFGTSVAIQGQTLVVGAVESDLLGLNSGAAFVFQWTADGWNLTQQLSPADHGAVHRLGKEVAIDGNRIVVSAHGAKSAYVFEYDDAEWIETHKLVASDGSATFGQSIAISGDVIVVGAPEQWAPGGIYIFELNENGTIEETIITPSADPNAEGWSGSGNGNFGQSVSIDGDTIVVGAGYSGVVWNGGAAFLYRHDGSAWTFEDKLYPPNVTSNMDSARIVSIDGDWIATGAPTQNNERGAAYVYHDNGASWAWVEELKPISPAHSQKFGQSIAISNGFLAVGVPMFSSTTIGEVYLYELTPAGAVPPLIVSDGQVMEHFGHAVGMSNGALAVGSPGYGYGGVWNPGEGAVYVVTPLAEAQEPCEPDPEPDPEPECIGDVNYDGVVDVLDLLDLIGQWGSCAGCPADLNDDDVVDVLDLLMLIETWGACPE